MVGGISGAQHFAGTRTSIPNWENEPLVYAVMRRQQQAENTDLQGWRVWQCRVVVAGSTRQKRRGATQRPAAEHRYARQRIQPFTARSGGA